MLNLKEKCCLFFCLPISYTEYLNEHNDPQKDFIRLFTENNRKEKRWEEYVEQIIKPFTKFKDFFSKKGVLVIDNGRYTDFISLINSQAAEVIILLTHCKCGGDKEKESIEFYDRMVLSSEILNTNLTNYPLILDVSVCNPLYLKDQIQIYHPGFACFSSEGKKDLSVWLLIYASVFAEMHTHRKNFSDAFLTVYKSYLR